MRQTLIGPAALEQRHSELVSLWPAPFAQQQQRRRTVVGAIYTPDGSEFDVENADELWLPLSGATGTSIAAGITQGFELKPNRTVVPGPLVFIEGIADNLVMTSLQFGGKNMFCGAGVIPCSMFKPGSFHKIFRGGAASTNLPITFELKNIHASAAQVVYGNWICLAQPLS